MAKKAHHIGASKGGFRAAVGGQSPAGVGATAGVNLKAFGSKFKSKPSSKIAGRGRKPSTPTGIGKNAGYGIKDTSSGGDLAARANSLFGIAKGKAKVTRDGGSNR